MNLKEENKGLREKLDKAYEFMRKFVIEGKSMLDKFLEWIGEKVRDGRLDRWSVSSTLLVLVLLLYRFRICLIGSCF